MGQRSLRVLSLCGCVATAFATSCGGCGDAAGEDAGSRAEGGAGRDSALADVSGRDSGRTDNARPDNAQADAGQQGVVAGIVVEPNGAVVSGVRVSAGARSASTGADGTFAIEDLDLGSTQALRFEKSGYARQFRSTTAVAAGSPPLRVTMKRRGPAIAFDASAALEQRLGPNGIKLEAGSLVTPTGDPVSGEVQMTFTPLDVFSDEIEAFPGDFAGTRTTQEEVMLETFGLVEIVFEQGGVELNLAAGKSAEVELQLSEEAALNDGDEVPAWYFDAERGTWIEEGLGTVRASSADPSRLSFYFAPGHFSWWNCDQPQKAFCFTGSAVDDSGNPIANAPVTARGVSYQGGASSQTDSQGNFCVHALKGEVSDLYLSASGLGGQAVHLAQVAAPDIAARCGSGNCQDLGQYVLPMLHCFTGRVVDGLSNPLPDLLVRSAAGANGLGAGLDAVTQSDGSFCVGAISGNVSVITAYPNDLMSAPGSTTGTAPYEIAYCGQGNCIDVGTITMPPAYCVTGTLVDPSGAGLSQANIRLSGVDYAGSSWAQADFAGDFCASVRGDGKTTALEFRHPNYAWAATAQRSVTAPMGAPATCQSGGCADLGQVTLNMSCVSGQVTDYQGNPRSGLFSLSTDYGLSGLARADGSFCLPAPGSSTVEVRVAGVGAATVLTPSSGSCGAPAGCATLMIATPSMVAVPGNGAGWTDSGVSVEAGDSIAVAATGSVTLDSAGTVVDPAGKAETACGVGCALPEANQGALLGRIGPAGNPIFVIGADYSGRVTLAGALFLQINDASPADNSGAFAVEITVQRAGTSTDGGSIDGAADGGVIDDGGAGEGGGADGGGADAGPLQPCDWTMVSPMNTFAVIEAVLPDSDGLYAGGEEGYVGFFDGAGWREMRLPDSMRVLALGAAGGEVFAATWGGVYRYRAGEWSVTEGQASGMTALWGLAPSSLWAAGYGGTIYRYDGSTWTQDTTLSFYDGVSTQYPQQYGLWGSGDSDIFSAGEGNRIWHYDGAAWSVTYDDVATSSTTWMAIWGDGTRVIAVGDNGAIVRHDGSAWQVDESGTGDALVAVGGAPGGDVLAVSLSGLVLRHDGVAWAIELTGTIADARTAAVGPEGTLWVGGDNGLVMRDTGAGWEQISGPLFSSDERLLSVVATAPGRAWMGGNWNGDGNQPMIAWDGTALTALPAQPEGDEVWDLQRLDDGQILAAGYSGVWRHDGAGWVTLGEMPAVNTVYGVWGAAADDVWAVSDNGYLAHFDGQGWTKAATATTAHLRTIWGDRPDRIFAGGANGTLLRYDGTRWTSLATGITLNIQDLWGPSGEYLFLAGWASTWGDPTAYVTDGVATYLPVPGVPRDEIVSVWGSTEQHVFFATGYEIYHFDGISLVSMTMPWAGTSFDYDVFMALHGTSERDVWVVGDFMILRCTGR